MLRAGLRHLVAFRRTGLALRARGFHVATADFVNRGVNGELVTRQVSIRIGEPGESYVLVSPDVGEALQAGSASSNGFTPIEESAKSAMSFFHDTQHFAHGTSHVIRLQLYCY